ncbi:MAG: mismatch repair protein [Acidobacteria bacterium]|nr:MAG: mismatch repair protein [Acidobacteriota bacterium]
MYSQPVQAADEYRQRLNDRESRVAQREAIHIRLGNIRLVLALMAAATAWESLKEHAFSPWWMVLPLSVFVGIAAYHSRTLRARDLAQRAVAWYRGGLARIEDRCAGAGQTGERFSDSHHVYAADLDLFGRGGLFELLSTARTRMGEDTLAKWLLSPSAVDEIVERHAAVRELRDQLDLKEDLAVLGEDAGVGVSPEALLHWAEAPNQMKPEWVRWFGVILSISAIAGAVVWGYFGIAAPLIVILAVEAIIRYRIGNSLENVLHGSEHAFRDLGLLSGVLARVERHAFSSPRLKSLQHDLSSHGHTSSFAIARLKTIVDLSDSRRNLIVGMLDLPLMYSIQVAFAAERWRRAHGHAVASWLSAIAEIEALICLGTYSYEHPGDPFPEFVQGATCFNAAEIGHPLIPAGACIRNNVRLFDGARVLLVSGSNMSGKSTLLRTVGINAVLAMAGAPVRARSLRLTPVQVGASIRINDSLREGSSRFYAEITRLRKLFDLAGGDPPLLFLLDELLQGTNSNDRRIGAEGVLCALLNRGAIGLVSTHDLALVDIGGPLNGQLHNVHFQEDFDNGRMSFDYKLREGVVTKSNGLALMRSIGLDV